MNWLRMDRVAMLVVGSCFLTAACGAVPLANSHEAFVVHEWGTFSTFSGSDGAYLKFYPDDRDLPEFIYSRQRHVKGGLPDVLVSLETPVLYFYSDRERTASVRVDFPKGRMTEWYPQASRPPIQGLAWDNIKILAPGQAVPLLRETAKSRYYAARETDASPVQVAAENDKQEHEKFLFYRGVGDFEMPLSARALGNGAFQVKNTGKHAIPGFVLVRVRGGKIFFQTGGRLSGGAEATSQQARNESTPGELGEAVAELLIGQGLYRKEARAMVKTWSSDWFGEDGSRILYLVPESLTREFLPLRIAPRPDALVRVLVGRHDVLTPESEREIDVLVKKLEGPSNNDAQAADKALNKLGRYRWPAQSAASARLKNLEEVRRQQ